MEELKAFFRSPKSTPTVLRAPATGGLCLTKNDELNLTRREDHRRSVLPTGTDYVREVRDREIQMYIENEKKIGRGESGQGGLESLENLSSFGSSCPDLENLGEAAMKQVYSKYSFQKKEDTKNLPINDYRQEILDRISGYPVVVIEGPTGSGKTTQVPQWILDDCYQACKQCKIIVTQPRRIAAISIARRVAQERGWDVGGVVGYQVGLDNKTSNDTRISYVTTGVLLQKLVASKTLNEYTHIILDEVHERGQEMDFLLIVVKRLLNTVSRGVKVILMSATFNTEVFAEYFRIPTVTGPEMTTCVKVMKKDKYFTVKKFYLNDLKKFGSILTSAEPKPSEPGIETEMHHLVIKLLDAFEQIDMKEDNVEDRREADLPSVLIFLPGINEIDDLYSCLTDLKLRAKVVDANCAKYNWWVLPLHSTITADEQVRVFQRAPPGQRKIILATNIAESSITVPDIKYVIDYCLMKVIEADTNTNFTSLKLKWASKTNCEQRAGRAGRVRDGRVYRLVNIKHYEMLPEESDPEIVRCPLERLVLLAKMLDMGTPDEVLALAMDPPDMSNIHRTLLVLKEVGALKKLIGDEWVASDGEITYLGRIMARLPLDVRATKLIVLGHIFGVLEEAIIMAAAMSVKSIFSSPFRERLNAYNSKLTWADGSTSDCITFLNVYKVWRHQRQQQGFKDNNKSSKTQVQWASQFYLQVRSLRELDDMVREIKSRLSREGIEENKNSPWSKQELPLALKVILAGAFYPQYFVQASQNDERERDAVRTLGGLNPRNTVFLKDFPENQPGEVYTSTISAAVMNLIGDEPRVTFDKNSRKVYLSFPDYNSQEDKHLRSNNGDPTIPGQVVLPIYKAIKIRQLRLDIRVPLLPPEKAQQLAEALQMDKVQINMEMVVPRLPEVDQTYIPLKISHLASVSRFWCQYDEESSTIELNRITSELNRQSLLAHTGTVSAGDIYAAPFTDNKTTLFYRVRVLRVLTKGMVEVRYIDYGNLGHVHVQNLFEVAGEACGAAPLALECALAGVAPSPLLDPHQQWTRDAVARFTHLAQKRPLFGKIYSVAHGVVAVELMADNGKININEVLIKESYAVPCEESYESKLNHDLRETAEKLSFAQRHALNREQLELAYYEMHSVTPPSRKECHADVVLKGPYSPLETKVQSMMYAGSDKSVNIEWHSVNSVLLDTDPQQMHERLLVAGEVGQNEIGSNLSLRHTTLMPNLPGLPAIIALLFCPTAEIHRDSSGSRYASALCGLGCDDEGTPRFPEHDVLVSVDADLNLGDIELINHVRHLMDYMMYCKEGQDAPSIDAGVDIPKLIHRDLIRLLSVRRKYRAPESVRNAWEWRRGGAGADDEDTLEITVPDILERTVVFPLHAPPQLHDPDPEHLLALKRDNDRLKMLVGGSSLSTNQDVSCKLCGTAPMHIHAMRIHLYSNTHKMREEDLQMFQS